MDLGWHPDDIEVIDCDLGQTGAAAELRAGFKEVVAQVTLGQVGIILSSEVTRLSRNCSDWYPPLHRGWYPLLDVCSYKNCLIADRDGIYDPGSTNGRLLLGIKGQLSELELHTIRGCMWAGLLNKAQRGELALRLPVGLVRDAQGRVVKDPHQEVQNCLTLVFHTFLRVKSAGKTLRFFREQDLKLPRPNRFGDVVWQQPTLSAILLILRNPVYAGAFVYGRTHTTRQLIRRLQHLTVIETRFRDGSLMRRVTPIDPECLAILPLVLAALESLIEQAAPAQPATALPGSPSPLLLPKLN